MQSIPGVIDAESGYANGTCEADADYKTVCKGETGFRETVRVEYDPEQVSLDALLLALLLCDRPHGTKPAGQRPGQPVPDRCLLHQRKRERNGEAHRGDRARPQREILRGDRPAQELLSRRGIPSELPRKNPDGYCHIPREEMELFPGCASTRATIRSPRRSPSRTS